MLSRPENRHLGELDAAAFFLPGVSHVAQPGRSPDASRGRLRSLAVGAGAPRALLAHPGVSDQSEAAAADAAAEQPGSAPVSFTLDQREGRPAPTGPGTPSAPSHVLS